MNLPGLSQCTSLLFPTNEFLQDQGEKGTRACKKEIILTVLFRQTIELSNMIIFISIISISIYLSMP